MILFKCWVATLLHSTYLFFVLQYVIGLLSSAFAFAPIEPLRYNFDNKILLFAATCGTVACAWKVTARQKHWLHLQTFNNVFIASWFIEITAPLSRAENIVFLLLCSFITSNTRFNNFQKIKHQKVSQINFTTSKGFQQQKILFQLLRSFARSVASISASNDRNYQKLHGLLASRAADRGQSFSLKWTRRYSDPVCVLRLYGQPWY